MKLARIEILAISILLLCSTPLLGTPFFGTFESAEITPLGNWDLKFGGGVIYLPEDNYEAVATHITPQLSLRYGTSPNLDIGGRLGLAVALDRGPVALLGAIVDLKVGTLRVPILGSFAGGAGLGLIDDGVGLSPVIELSFYRSHPVWGLDSLHACYVGRIKWFVVTGLTRGQWGIGLNIRFTESFHAFLEFSFALGADAFGATIGLMASSRF